MTNCQDCIMWKTREKGWGVCTLASSSNGEPNLPQTYAYASDYESYQAEFKTHHTFACNQGRKS